MRGPKKVVSKRVETKGRGIVDIWTTSKAYDSLDHMGLGPMGGPWVQGFFRARSGGRLGRASAKQSEAPRPPNKAPWAPVGGGRKCLEFRCAPHVSQSLRMPWGVLGYALGPMLKDYLQKVPTLKRPHTPWARGQASLLWRSAASEPPRWR